MSRINYKSLNSENREKYLYPDKEETSLLDVLVPAASYALFFTPASKHIGKFVGNRINGVAGKALGIAGSVKKNAMAAKESSLSLLKPVGEITKKGRKLGIRGVGEEATAGIKSKAQEMSDVFSGKFGGRINNMTDSMETGVKSLGRGVSSIVPKISGLLDSALSNTPALAVAGLAAGAGVMMGQGSGIQPIATVGAGYPQGTEWVKTRKKGLRPGHLGATGDLVFAMRGAR